MHAFGVRNHRYNLRPPPPKKLNPLRPASSRRHPAGMERIAAQAPRPVTRPAAAKTNNANSFFQFAPAKSFPSPNPPIVPVGSPTSPPPKRLNLQRSPGRVGIPPLQEAKGEGGCSVRAPHFAHSSCSNVRTHPHNTGKEEMKWKGIVGQGQLLTPMIPNNAGACGWRCAPYVTVFV